MIKSFKFSWINSLAIIIIISSACKVETKQADQYDNMYGWKNVQLKTKNTRSSNHKKTGYFYITVGALTVLGLGITGLIKYKNKPEHKYKNDSDENIGSDNNSDEDRRFPSPQPNFDADNNSDEDRRFSYVEEENLEPLSQGQRKKGLRILKEDGIKYERNGYKDNPYYPLYEERLARLGLIYESFSEETKSFIKGQVEKAQASKCQQGATANVISVYGICRPCRKEGCVLTLISDEIYKFNMANIELASVKVIEKKNPRKPHEGGQTMHAYSGVAYKKGHELGLNKQQIREASQDIAKNCGWNEAQSFYYLIKPAVYESFKEDVVTVVTGKINEYLESNDHWLDYQELCKSFKQIDQSLKFDVLFTESEEEFGKMEITKKGTKEILDYLGWFKKDGSPNLEDQKQRVCFDDLHNNNFWEQTFF